MRMTEALKVIMQVKQAKSLALEDILSELHRAVIETKFTEEMKIFLICRMAEIEYRLSQGCYEKVQTAALAGAFIEVRTYKVRA